MSSVERELLELVVGSIKWDRDDPTSVEVMRRVNAALREQPEARGVVDDDPISIYKAYAKGVNAGMGGFLPDDTEALLAEAVEVGTLCNLAAEDTLDAGMTATADALSKAALTITNLGRAVAALTAAQQPVQEGDGEAVAWLGCNPRTGVPVACAYKPSPTVMREFNMRPLIYADNAPPSAPVGVDGPHGFIHWLDEGYEIEWLREWRGGNCHLYLAQAPDRASGDSNDAARWRWAAAHAELHIPLPTVSPNSLYRDDSKDVWDAVIDAAMGTQQPAQAAPGGVE